MATGRGNVLLLENPATVRQISSPTRHAGGLAGATVPLAGHDLRWGVAP